MYQELADMACARIHAGITRRFEGEQPIRAVLDPYNPTGSSMHVNFYTSKRSRWQTDSRKCQVNWVVLDSDWEGEFCRVVEAHPRVRAYVKNQGLGLEVPYRYGSNMRKYIPDFIVQIDDGHEDPLNLIVEIKGYRGEDAKEKKATMDTYWIPGVNHLGTLWALGFPGTEGCLPDADHSLLTRSKKKFNQHDRNRHSTKRKRGKLMAKEKQIQNLLKPSNTRRPRAGTSRPLNTNRF